MKVTCKLIGGFSNCLWIMAATLSYSLKYGIDYCILETIENPHSTDQKVYQSSQIRYCNKEDFRGVVKVYTEPFFHFQEIPKYDCDVLILSGYFQSILFFKDYLSEI